MTSMSQHIRLHPNDDVVIARQQLMSGATVENIAVRGLIPPGHKIATRAIAPGEPVRRYNQIIGFASQAIAAGEHIHVHNLNLGDNKGDFARDYAFCADVKPAAPLLHAQFMGHVRADGRVATRNYIGILSSVNCSATVARAIADHFSRTTNPSALAAFPNVDGVVALTHGSGCGMDTEGLGMQVLERTMAGYATHPNFGAVLAIGLGCEANQLKSWLSHSGLTEGKTLQTFNIQDSGGTAKTVAKGIAMVKAMLPDINLSQRQACSAAHLTVGLQCGGSDGYSGISANPALGAAVDLLVAHGGTAILSETPEIYGAEHLLTRRAVSRAVGEKLVQRIRWWEHYTAMHSGEMNNNPSPGNKAGGLTSGLRVRRKSRCARVCVHGHAGLRPGQRHRSSGRRRQPDLLYHRSRLCLWLCALAFIEIGHQHRLVGKTVRRHRHQLRRDCGRRHQRSSHGASDLRAYAVMRLGRIQQERVARLWPK